MTTMSSSKTDAAAPPSEPVEVTPSVGFAWVMQGIRPYLGFVFIGLGLLALFLGWYGASGTPIVAKQIPYLASDGVLAIVLIAIGNRIFLINDLRRDSGRLDRLEEMVAELHAVLLTSMRAVEETNRPGSAAAAVAASSGGKPYRAVAKGTSYHRADCAMVSGKDTIRIGKADIASRKLKPCRVCEPQAL
ncbi:MAG TPA: hypothetical protein VGF84_12595 [Micromonosporaceae bacterium]